MDDASDAESWGWLRNERFVAAWNAGRPLNEIARSFGITEEQAYVHITRLRRVGKSVERREDN